MKIAGKECLPLLSCNVQNNDGVLRLNKVIAFRIINGTPLSFANVVAEFSYLELSYTIPLRVVPLYWLLKILHKLGINKSRWYHKQWDKIDSYQTGEPEIKDKITEFKIGVTFNE